MSSDLSGTRASRIADLGLRQRVHAPIDPAEHWRRGRGPPHQSHLYGRPLDRLIQRMPKHLMQFAHTHRAADAAQDVDDGRLNLTRLLPQSLNARG